MRPFLSHPRSLPRIVAGDLIALPAELHLEIFRHLAPATSACLAQCCIFRIGFTALKNMILHEVTFVLVYMQRE